MRDATSRSGSPVRIRRADRARAPPWRRAGRRRGRARPGCAAGGPGGAQARRAEPPRARGRRDRGGRHRGPRPRRRAARRHDAADARPATVERERARAAPARRALPRRTAAPLDVRGRTVIVVDDGLATGSDRPRGGPRAARRGADGSSSRFPWARAESVALLGRGGRRGRLPRDPRRPPRASASWYRDFSPVSDEEVLALLGRRPGAAPRRLARHRRRWRRRAHAATWTVPAARRAVS